ncbi:hypothetical protein [Subtercola vilae]|uniref:hypothetical protein n=1 Tax=Subtercola vilae TaxID=2056433 RepID=UPI0010A9A874|nr:hypothetical protein [Subtercola vilae]
MTKPEDSSFLPAPHIRELIRTLELLSFEVQSHEISTLRALYKARTAVDAALASEVGARRKNVSAFLSNGRLRTNAFGDASWKRIGEELGLSETGAKKKYSQFATRSKNGAKK